MKVLFVREVLGIQRLNYYLFRSHPEMHKKYLMELLEAGYMEDISEVFETEEDRKIMRNNSSILEVNGKMYIFPSSWDEICKKMRTQDKGIEITERYNQYLEEPMKISYQEIKDEDYNRMLIAEWDDGSESVLFNE